MRVGHLVVGIVLCVNVLITNSFAKLEPALLQDTATAMILHVNVRRDYINTCAAFACRRSSSEECRDKSLQSFGCVSFTMIVWTEAVRLAK